MQKWNGPERKDEAAAGPVHAAARGGRTGGKTDRKKDAVRRCGDIRRGSDAPAEGGDGGDRPRGGRNAIDIAVKKD